MGDITTDCLRAYFQSRLAAERGAAGDLAKGIDYSANTIEQLRANWKLPAAAKIHDTLSRDATPAA